MKKVFNINMGKSSNKDFSFLSLFSGCGGFDLGFLDEGYRCIGAYDIDPQAISVHKTNLNSPAHTYDLSRPLDNSFASLDPDVVIAGPPCQGFSTNGKRDFDDPRNHLLIRAGEIATEFEPKAIIIENVAGVTSGKHATYWNNLKKLLRQKKYKIIDDLIPVSLLGVPQMRKRRILIASIMSIESSFALIQSQTENSVRNVLETIDESVSNHDVKFPSADSEILKIANKIKPGQKLSNVRGGDRAVHTWDIPEVFGDTTKKERNLLELLIKLRRRNRKRNWGDADPVDIEAISSAAKFPVKRLINSLHKKGYIRRVNGHYDLSHTFNGKFRRLKWNGLSPTVHTRFGNPNYFLHPEEDRGLTVREAARIQGFPDSFIFSGKTTDQYRLIGNAVPPPLARYIAGFVKKNILVK